MYARRPSRTVPAASAQQTFSGLWTDFGENKQTNKTRWKKKSSKSLTFYSELFFCNMNENYTSQIIYRYNYDLFHKGNTPILWLIAGLGQLHGEGNCYSKNNQFASAALSWASSKTNTVLKWEKRKRDPLPDRNDLRQSLLLFTKIIPTQKIHNASSSPWVPNFFSI